MENREVLLKVENLCQYFRMGRHVNKAVDNVSFEIYRGEVFGLVGESGCGKTTTGRSIIKLYDITSGDVYFKGRRICAGIQSYKNAISLARKDAREKIQNLNNDSKLNPENKSANDGKIKVIKSQLNEIVKNNKTLIDLCKIDQKYCDKLYAKDLVKELEEEYKNKPKDDEYYKSLKIAKKARLVTQIQMIFQDPIASLNPRMTVQEIIAEGLIIKGITDKKYIQEKVYEILELVGLVKEHATRYPHEFSGGQKQRIGIARAIIMQPDMIIADEPVSALDVSIQAQVINLLNELREKLGLTILFIAHDLSVVKYFSDRIGVMYYGKLVELASSDELFAHPIHPYTRSLLSAIPLPDPVYEKKRVRMVYNPIAEHDYRYDKPTFREIRPNHFVYCNDAEEAKYKEQF
ncbi:MAG: ATP-binding cassette domain-containing protein [Erysipelotrichaceae bacterium]|nr:ATP-binding cassette domain-containing protein [Erysipelotrichaceae bacterium]